MLFFWFFSRPFLFSVHFQNETLLISILFRCVRFIGEMIWFGSDLIQFWFWSENFGSSSNTNDLIDICRCYCCRHQKRKRGKSKRDEMTDNRESKIENLERCVCADGRNAHADFGYLRMEPTYRLLCTVHPCITTEGDQRKGPREWRREGQKFRKKKVPERSDLDRICCHPPPHSFFSLGRCGEGGRTASEYARTCRPNLSG